MNTSAPDELPHVSIIIPHYQDLESLNGCLAALDAQTYPRCGLDVIVADNNSPCGLAAVENVISGRARLLTVSEKGAGPARNGGAALANGEILAFIDSDCLAEPNWVEEGVAALAMHDIVGGRVTVLTHDPSAPSAVEAFEAVFAFNFKDYILRKGFTGSGNLFVPRAIFETVGGFRPAVSEDVDWSFRARALGYGIGYAPAAVVGHPARRTWNELVRKWQRVMREQYLLARERPWGRLRWILRSWALPPSVLIGLAKIAGARQLPSLRSKLGAAFILVRIRLWRFVVAHKLLMGL